MLSRLKGIETWAIIQAFKESTFALDMLSRLKGIETVKFMFSPPYKPSVFGYAFPFEGNWNDR